MSEGKASSLTYCEGACYRGLKVVAVGKYVQTYFLPVRFGTLMKGAKVTYAT